MRRFGTALVLALALVALSVPAVFAVPPVQVSYELHGGYTYTAGSLCAFDVQLHYDVWTSRETSYYDQTGALVRLEGQAIEQDTFYGPSGTLVGDPYLFNYTQKFDVTGQLISWTASGWVEQVTLPDGTKFWTVGWTNFLAVSGPAFNPTSGRMGNLAAFCAALG